MYINLGSEITLCILLCGLCDFGDRTVNRAAQHDKKNKCHCKNERYSDDGIIWFIEACDLNVMGMRRAMWQMKNAGWFSNVKGFLIGRPAHFGEEMFGIDHRQALSSLLREFNVPIIMDLDIGHMSPMMPVVCGSMADVSFDGSSFTISYDIEQ